jgi:argininosuccinate lyase
MSPLWGGRFTGQTDPLMARFNASLPFDWRLWDADITGSIAWARAIARAGLLTTDERDQIITGLEAVRDEIAPDPAAAFAAASDEDIHSYVERRLTEQIGAAAGKLHTGRSRNDQVATDVRLWLKWQIEGRGQGSGIRDQGSGVGNHRSASSFQPLASSLDVALADLIRAAADRAEAELDVLMPGYTHVQPAQPVRWSHWLLSHAWAWQRDRERQADLLARVNVSPLGSGALAGCPFPIDRAALAADLGFASASLNSLDAVSDRDFIAEFLFWAALTGVHLSQWAEDLVIWSSREFGYVTLADAYSTGSSLMPQKKNPDAAELLRGKAGRLVGGLTGLLVTLKGLPSSYDKDLQEDKEALFDAVDTLALALPVGQGVLATLTIHPDRMRAALGDELLATDLADALVLAGVPFRQSHHLVGQVVRRAEELGCPLRAVPLADLRAISPYFTADMAAVWDFERSVEQRSATGGTSRAAVLTQIEALRAAS